MPIDIHATRDDVDEFTIKYGGEQTRVRFYPNAMTGDWSLEANKHEQGGDFEQMYQMLAEPLLEWEIYDNGKLLDTTGESIAILPIGLIGAIAQGMVEAATKRGVVVKRSRKSVFESLFGGLPNAEEDKGEDG